MPCLQHARLPQERTDGVAGLCADVEPVIRAFRIELDGFVAQSRIVRANDLDEAPIARARSVGDDDTKARRILAAGATKANTNSHWYDLLLGVL